MKIETRKIQHTDGRLEVRRIFADENMAGWDAKNPLAFDAVEFDLHLIDGAMGKIIRQ